MESTMCGACGIRPDTGAVWHGKVFGRPVTYTGLCRTCGTLGPDRSASLPDVVDVAECGCSRMGRCPLHAAQDALGVEDVRGWQSVGNDWTFEREIARADAAAGTERVLVVAAHVAAQVEGHADVRSVVWLPDGRAEVTFIDHEAGVIAPAKLVPMGLLATDEAMRDVLVNRETWTRWQWRGDAHKARTARTVCRTCRATYSAQRTTPHTCGERLDSRGRALVSDTRKVGLAALGRARFALMRGKAIADADRAAIEAAGLEVPA